MPAFLIFDEESARHCREEHRAGSSGYWAKIALGLLTEYPAYDFIVFVNRCDLPSHYFRWRDVGSCPEKPNGTLPRGAIYYLRSTPGDNLNRRGRIVFGKPARFPCVTPTCCA